MRPQNAGYLSNRAEQEQEAAKDAKCANARLVHFDLAARYRMRARSIELGEDR